MGHIPPNNGIAVAEITLQIQDAVATIAIDLPQPKNSFRAENVRALSAQLDTALEGGARCVVLRGAGPVFSAGWDIGAIDPVDDDPIAMIGQVVGPLCRQLRVLPVPTIAAVAGPALGFGFGLALCCDIVLSEEDALFGSPFRHIGMVPDTGAHHMLLSRAGLEICLACHRRIVADDPKIQLGVPEVSLGLLPAAGGTQRMPRMIGIKAALPYLLEGRKVAPAQALEAGIVDELVPTIQLLTRARAWLLADGPQSTVKPWDAKGFKFPGGTPQTPGPTQLYFGIAGNLLGKTQGLYPAPEAILACVYDGCQVGIDVGLKIEQRQFAHLATSAVTKNMIRTLFYSMGEANRLADRPKGVPKRDYTRIGVLGAGMMGAALAHVSALAGLQVVLLDTSLQVAEKGKAYGARILEAQVAKGRLTGDQCDQILSLVEPTTDYAALADCQIVIEAVFEDRAVKAEATRRAEAAMPPDAIFASNTSTLPITGLAEVSARPAQFVGLHFFSPVEKMPLVEVIRGKATAEATIAHALDFVKRIRKTPIVVNDCPAFYANRAFGMFPYEAMTMLAEGVSPNLIENASRMAGMPMPPLALIDEFSAELLYKALRQSRIDQGDAYRAQPQDEVLVTMVEKLGRLGRKVGKGFYDYPAGGKKTLWAGLAELYPLAAQQPSVDEVRRRLMYAQSLEAARCLADGVVSARDADVGSLLGWGFPAALGGAVSHIDTIGAARFVEECDELARRHGERFKVPQALRELAAAGGRYLKN